MKSVNKRFEKISKKNPYWSTYVCFSEAIKNQKFCKKNLYFWFSKLVSKNDYALSDKRAILRHLCDLSKEPVESIKQG